MTNNWKTQKLMRQYKQGIKSLIWRTLPISLLLVSAVSSAKDPVLVTTAALGEIQVFPQHSAPAKVVSLNQSQISAQLNATIKEVAVRVGDKVKKNQILVKLDCRDSELARSSALARKQLAEKELARADKLKNSSSIAISNLNHRQTELTQAKIEHRKASLQVERCTIKAPYDGVITERTASVASLAAPGTPLLNIVDSKRLELRASISSSEVDNLETATQISFTSHKQSYPLKLRTVVPLVDSESNNQDARFDFIGTTPLIGISGRIEWKEKIAHIPANIILERNGKPGMFIADKDTAKFMPLDLVEIGQDAAVSLPEDTEVIVDGRFGLNPDDPIRLADPK